jgi:hypothetical protein
MGRTRGTIMARRVYVVRGRRNGLAGLIAVLAVVGALALTNPTMGDFKSFINRSASKKTGSNFLGGAVSGLAGGFYTRRNYVVFSIFEPGINGSTPRYTGLLKGLFINMGK